MPTATTTSKAALREQAHQYLNRGDRALVAGRYKAAATTLAKAVSLFEQAFGPRHVEVAAPLNQLAMAYRYLARFVDAGMAYQRALHLLTTNGRAESMEAADVFHNLGGLEHAAGNWLRGEPYAREAVRIRTKLLGRNHPAVAHDLTALAALLDRQKKPAKVKEAERMNARALAILEREYGPDHHLVAVALNNLAAIRHERKASADAEAMYRRALAIEEAQLGPTHPKVAFTLNNLAVLMKDTRRPREAAALFKRALTLFTRELGGHHPNVGVCLENYAEVLKKTGQKAAAQRASKQAARIMKGIDAVNETGVAVTGTVNPLFTNYRLSARASAIHRLGVFAEEDIPAWHKVIEYTGERISVPESERRWNPHRSYLFELTDRVHLDGAIGGSGAEYINHCCDPNLKTRIQKLHILYYSRRPIKAGEELTVDYRYEHDADRMPCHCGSPKCRGTMNMLPPRKKKRKKRSEA